ncbi:metallophosphoesterase N-terminal domain-containing protein [Streptomyces violaceusniger]|uniref:metallophosphoesterase N-terminal domain-containing protein n=1 Tax=Streptomyces violaceusniger TaxID=68280 RepID=UPI0001E4B364
MKNIRAVIGLCLALLFLVLGIGAQPAAAHVSRQHAELVVATSDKATSGRLIVHRDLVSPERAGAWATGLLPAGCPATGSGVPGDDGGVPGGVVIELAWSCHVNALDLSRLLQQGGLTQVVVEFDGTAVDASADAPLVDAEGAHALPSFPWLTVAFASAAGLVLVLAALRLPTLLRVSRRLLRTGRRWRIAAASAVALSFLVPQAALADDPAPDTATVEGTVFKDGNGNGKRDKGERAMAGVDVTDGAVWTTTGADGAYSLTIDPNRRETDIVSIVSPDGYTPVLRKDYIPEFFHKVPETGGSGVDFALVPDRHAADPTETWVMNSDPEISNVTDGAAGTTLPQWTGQVQAMSEVDGATMQIATGDLTVTDYGMSRAGRARTTSSARGWSRGGSATPSTRSWATTTSAARPPRRATPAAWSTTAATWLPSGTASTATAATSSSSRTTMTRAG